MDVSSYPFGTVVVIDCSLKNIYYVLGEITLSHLGAGTVTSLQLILHMPSGWLQSISQNSFLTKLLSIPFNSMA